MMNFVRAIAPVRNLLVIALLLPALGGCVSMWTGDEMRADITALQAEQKATRESLDSEKTRLTEMIASARGEVAELQGVLKDARALLQRNNADLGAELQKTREQMSALNGMLEELDFKLKRVDQDLQLFKEDTDLRFAGSPLGANLPDDPKALLEQAKKDYDAKDWRNARKAFEKFLQRFSKDRGAAEAQYLLGMTYFQQDQWATAVFELQKVLKTWERSAQVPDATYHIAYSLMKMKRCDQAAAWFELLIDEHPKTHWASEALPHLQRAKTGKCG